MDTPSLQPLVFSPGDHSAVDHREEDGSLRKINGISPFGKACGGNANRATRDYNTFKAAFFGTCNPAEKGRIEIKKKKQKKGGQLTV